MPELLAKHAQDFIRKHADEPFFLYIPHGVPHSPYQGPDDNGFRVPGRHMVRSGKNQKQMKKAYRQMVKAFDRSVGRIMKTLNQEDIAKNTFVFVCSDNGAAGPGSNGSLKK